ncbi:hypothetical protein C8J57DRAFT_1536489 [Mycena rebaudengoi]|nr:hypothetical protein C8J57DRAFT_1536489 [Mycena rebaudengoi]
MLGTVLEMRTLVDILSAPLSSFNRRIGIACGIKIIKGARLIEFERAMDAMVMSDEARAATYAFPTRTTAAVHVTKPEGYRAVSYQFSSLLSGHTAPIFIPASFGCGGVPTYSMNSNLEATYSFTYSEDQHEESLLNYDALEYFEWSWELSLGSTYRGDFNHIRRLPPLSERVRSRHYDPVRTLWSHPYAGEWGERAELAQNLPLTGREIADVFRSYSINGLFCDPSIHFLAPDCFAPTLMTAEDMIPTVWRHKLKEAEDHNFRTVPLEDRGGGFYVDVDGRYIRPAVDRMVELREEEIYRSRIWR